ncbi:MAG: F-box protein [Candidatus Amoebophilus sp.]
MKRYYTINQKFIAYVLLISFFSQSCGGSHNLPIRGEEELSATTTVEQEEGQEQGRRKRARIEIGEEQEQRLIGQQEDNPLPVLMPELWQEIFSYLDFEGILAARSVSPTWNELITGFRQAGISGVENKPCHIIDTRGWTRKKEINFHCYKLRMIHCKTIPSFAFYHLMG